MMSREQMLQVLSSMDESKLASALGAAGVDSGHQGGGMGGDGDDDDGLTSWNATQVQVPGGNRPALFDKTAHVAPEQGVGRRRMELEPEATGMEDYAPPRTAIGLGAGQG